jgi:hypothetical protein
MSQSATLIFLGRFRPQSFLDFVRRRADRLSLDAEVGAISADLIEVSVAGPRELVDAFEIACSLGPLDCIVLDHSRVETGYPADEGEHGSRGS